MLERRTANQILTLAVMFFIAVSSQATVHVVTMSGVNFSPQITTVKYGDTVRWVGVSGVHTTTSVGNLTKMWDSGMMNPGDHFEVSFKAADGQGPFPYVCQIHSVYGMAAVIGVDQAMGVNEPDQVPASFRLAQNYPNPFNPSTTIAYSVPSQSHVVISVFDVLGQEVRTLTDEAKSAGNYQVVWDGNDKSGRAVGSGVYLYRIIAGDFMQSRKMLLMK